MSMNTETVTVREAAEILGVDNSTVQRWVGTKLRIVQEIGGGEQRPGLRLLDRLQVVGLRDERAAEKAAS